jgi:hypothetical protein
MELKGKVAITAVNERTRFMLINQLLEIKDITDLYLYDMESFSNVLSQNIHNPYGIKIHLRSESVANILDRCVKDEIDTILFCGTHEINYYCQQEFLLKAFAQNGIQTNLSGIVEDKRAFADVDNSHISSFEQLQDVSYVFAKPFNSCGSRNIQMLNAQHIDEEYFNILTKSMYLQRYVEGVHYNVFVYSEYNEIVSFYPLQVLPGCTNFKDLNDVQWIKEGFHYEIVEQYIQRISREKQKLNHWWEVEFIIDHLGDIWFIECNPRITTALPICLYLDNEQKMISNYPKKNAFLWSNRYKTIATQQVVRLVLDRFPKEIDDYEKLILCSDEVFDYSQENILQLSADSLPVLQKQLVIPGKEYKMPMYKREIVNLKYERVLYFNTLKYERVLV